MASNTCSCWCFGVFPKRRTWSDVPPFLKHPPSRGQSVLAPPPRVLRATKRTRGGASTLYRGLCAFPGGTLLKPRVTDDDLPPSLPRTDDRGMRSPWDVPPGFPQSEQHHLIDSTTWFVIAVIFAATLIRSTIGFGEALIAVPVLALRIPVAVAAPLAVLISVTVAAIIIAQDWRSVHVGSAAGLVVWALLGIPLGLLLLTHANQRVVKTILAIVIAAFSLYSLLFRSRLHLKKDHASWLFAAGFLSGILGGAYGMNGPPLAVYGALRRWSPQHFRATLQGYFLPASLAGLLGYALIGLWTWPVTRYFLLSLPAALVATLIGRSLNRTFSGPAFLRSVHAGLLVIAAVLLVQTLSR